MTAPLKPRKKNAPEAKGAAVPPRPVPRADTAPGPLSQLVRSAARGPQGQPDWTAVTQQVTQRYHALGGRVSQPDLLAALRGIADRGAQEQLIVALGGPQAEDLRHAVQQAGAGATGAAPAPQVRVAAPRPVRVARAATAASPLASPSAAHAEEVRGPAPKSPAAAPARKGTEPHAAPTPGAGATARPRGQGAASQRRAKAPAAQAQPVAAQGAAPAAKKQGGGKGGDLKVVAASVFQELGLAPQPTWRQGDKLVFEGQNWKQAEAQVRQALHARQAEGPEEDGAPHAAQPAGPVQVPSAVIRAADLRKHEEQNRQRNRQTLSRAVKQARQTRSTLNSVTASATPLIQAAQQQAEKQVQAALSRTLAQIGSAEASARQTVTARAAQAQAAVNSAYQSAVQGVRQDTKQKITQLRQDAQTLKMQLGQEKQKLSTQVRGEFTSAQTAMLGAGQSVAGTARQIGNAQANLYRDKAVPEQNALQELANGKDYEEKKKAARIKAAQDTGNGYAQGMLDAGSEQARAVMGSLPDALNTHTTLLREYQNGVQQVLSGKISALQAQQAAALSAAAAQRTAALAQIRQGSAQAQAGIRAAAAKGRAQAGAQATQARQRARQQGQQAITGVRARVTQAGRQLDARIQQVQAGSAGHLNQEQAAFAQAMTGFSGYVRQGVQSARSGALGSARQAAAQVRAGAAPTTQALGGLGKSVTGQLTGLSTQAGVTLGAAGRSGSAGLQRTLSGHRQATGQTATAAKREFQQYSAGFRKDAGKLLQDTRKQLQGAVGPFRSALLAVLHAGNGSTKAEVPAIQDAAQKAENAVQPRWKAIMSVVIDVVIVIATIAAIAALGAVLGPVGLVLAGMAIGALGAVAGQALKDVMNNEFSGWGKYGLVAMGGAIGGAFGGAGGLVGGALSKGLAAGLARQGVGRVTQFGARVAMESAVGTGFDLAGQVVTGYGQQAVFGQPYDLKATFSAGNVLKTAALNSAGTFLGNPSTVKFVSVKLSNLKLPGKGLLGTFRNKLSGSRVVQAGVRQVNRLDDAVRANPLARRVQGALESGGERLGDGLGRSPQQLKNAADWMGTKATQVKADVLHGADQARAWGQTKLNEAGGAYTRVTNALERQPLFFKMREQLRAATDPAAFREAVRKTQADIDASIQAIPDPEVRRVIQEHVHWIEQHPHLFSSGKDRGVFYSGGKDGLSNHKLVTQYRDANPDLVTRIDDTPGGKHLEGLELYTRFPQNPEYADIVWKKASQQYARNTRGHVHEFVDGANPVRVYGTVEKPILDVHPRLGGRTPHANPGQPAPAGDVTVPAAMSGPVSGGHGPYFDPARVPEPGTLEWTGGHGGPERDLPPSARRDEDVDSTPDADDLTPDDLQQTQRDVEQGQVTPVRQWTMDDLTDAGLPRESLDGLKAEDRQALGESLGGWNSTQAGRNQGVVHTLDYAQGAGGSGKENRLLKLAEYTGKGPFDAADPMLVQRVTQALDELTAAPSVPPRQVGDKEFIFVAKDGAAPPYSKSQKGIIVIRFQGRYSTFMNGKFKDFGGME